MVWMATVFTHYVGLVSNGEAARPPVSADLTSSTLHI